MAQKPQQQAQGDICPDCGAVNSIVVDTQKGYVVCNECASVLEMGLEEYEGTRYEEDFVGYDADDARAGATAASGGGRGGGGRGGGTNRNQTPKDKYTQKAEISIDYFTNVSKVPHSIADTAKGMVREITTKSKSLNEQTDHPVALAAACFQISACKRNMPVQFAELSEHVEQFVSSSTGGGSDIRGMKKLTSGVLDDLRQKVLKALPEIHDDHYKQTQKPEAAVRDLVTMYLQRLGWNLNIYLELICGMTLRFPDVCGKSGFSLNARVAGMLFLSRTSTLVCERVTGSKPLLTTQVQQLYNILKMATFEPRTVVDRVCGAVQSLHHVQGLVQGLRGAAASTATGGSGTGVVVVATAPPPTTTTTTTAGTASTKTSVVPLPPPAKLGQKRPREGGIDEAE